jgi:regulatory protein
MRAPPPTPPTPDETTLHEAALGYLARYAATRATLARMLARRIDRWARAVAPEAAAVAAARAAVARVVERLVAAGAVDDAAFAAARARRLTREGRSAAATAAHLAARGVGADARRAALSDDPAVELAAAVAFIRRRRFGPFRAKPADAEARRKELAALARAGFGQGTARQALGLTREAAEAALARLRGL